MRNSIHRWASSRLDNCDIVGTETRVNCPFCASRIGMEDTKRHLHISMVKPVAHCFRCDWGGHYASLIMSVEGCSYPQAVEYIGSPVPDIGRFDGLYSPRGLVKTDEFTCEPVGFTYFYGYWPESIEGKAALSYAKKRLNIRKNGEDILNKFGYVPGSNRLWILIDEWFWQGRLITDGYGVKYISPPWPKGDSLWNAEALEIYEHITICEGVFSAYHAGPKAVGLCAKSATREQVIRIVSASPESITIMLDAGAGGESIELSKMLIREGYNGTIYFHWLYKGDPANSLKGFTVKHDWSTRVGLELDSNLKSLRLQSSLKQSFS